VKFLADDDRFGIIVTPAGWRVLARDDGLHAIPDVALASRSPWQTQVMAIAARHHASKGRLFGSAVRG
jgi:hypothetical protein